MDRSGGFCPSPSLRRARRVLLLLALTVGCGARTTLTDGAPPEDPAVVDLDAPSPSDAGPPDASPEAGPPDAAPPDASIDVEPPDSGPDAEPPDASTDAEPPDSGPDAEPPDAGPDAEPSDAGPDAEPPDSGPDAEPPDSGPDAEPPDSGPDAEPPDSGPDAGPEVPGTFVCTWAKRFGDAKKQNRVRHVVTPAGTILVAAQFYGSISLGGPTYTSQVINNDLVLAELSPDGSHLWSKTFSQTGYALYLDDLTTDAAGNIYLATYGHGTVDFGGGPLVSQGLLDIYLAKLTPQGDHLWSQRYGGEGEQRVLSVGLDAQGNAYYVGDFQLGLDLGGTPLFNPKPTARDLFLLRLDPDGKHVASRAVESTAGATVFRATTDASGRQRMVGRFLNSIDLGGGSLPAGPKEQYFYASFDASLTHLGSEAFTGEHSSSPLSIGLAPGGESLLVGYFSGTLGYAGESFSSQGDNADLLVSRLDPDGKPLLLTRLGDEHHQSATAVASSPSGDMLLGGTTEGLLDLGAASLSVDPSGEPLAFLARFAQSGQPLNSFLFGGTGAQEVQQITPLGSGDLIVSGSFSGVIDAGMGPLASAGEQDIFIARCHPTQALE